MDERPHTLKDLATHLAIATSSIGSRSIDQEFGATLNNEFPVDGVWFAPTADLCCRGVEGLAMRQGRRGSISVEPFRQAISAAVSRSMLSKCRMSSVPFMLIPMVT